VGRKCSLSIAAWISLVGLTGCASGGTNTNTNVPAGASAIGGSVATPFVETSEWAGEGARLRDMKMSAQADPNSEPSALPGDYGTWAYETDPIDIAGDGKVTLRAQVPASLTVTGNGNGLGYVFPPDKKFHIQIVRYDETKNADGTNEIEVFIVISDLTAPYPGFRAWLY
jgi:hypothetical protein